MWYKIALKGHKTRYDFQDLSYELVLARDFDDYEKKDQQKFILKAYDLEHMDKDKPVGKMEFTLTYYPWGKKQLEISLVRTDDYHEGMGVATNLYKWLKYNIEMFNKPEFLVSLPFNTQAERIREKQFGEPKRKYPMHEYEMDYSQGKLDI